MRGARPRRTSARDPGELQSKVIAEMIKSLSSGVPKERAVEKAFKAGAYWWQIGEHFGMSSRPPTRR